MTAENRGLLKGGNKDDAFTKTGYSQWKKALERFEKHQNSDSHHEAVDILVTTPSSTKDVSEMLSPIHAQEKTVNRKMLSTIMTTVRYLGRQGLALRGRYKSEEDTGEKGELDSNFLQLLYLRAEDIEGLKKWMSKSMSTKTELTTQVECISLDRLCRYKFIDKQ